MRARRLSPALLFTLVALVVCGVTAGASSTFTHAASTCAGGVGQGPCVPPPPPAAPSCVDPGNGGTTVIACNFGVSPVRFPVATVLSESELALASLDGSSGSFSARREEWKDGGQTMGHCSPLANPCSFSPNVRTSPTDVEYDPSDPGVANAAAIGGTGGGGDVARGDLNLDGREDVVLASHCGATSEVCLTMQLANDPGQGTTVPTGLYTANPATDPARIRVAVGPIAQQAFTVTGATFAVSADGKSTTATFTTDAAHGLVPGQGLRFDPLAVADLKAALCADANCIGEDIGDNYQAVADVPSPTTFTIDLGVITSNDDTAQCPDGFTCRDDGVEVPAPWSGSADGIGVRPGIAVAFVGVGRVVQLATFSATFVGGATELNSGDVQPVGTDLRTAEPLAIATGNFDGSGASQIVVAWGGTCAGSATPCGRFSFYRTTSNDQLQLVGASAMPALLPGAGGDVQDVSIAVGSLTTTGNSTGDDIAFSYIATTPGCQVGLATPWCGGSGVGVADVSASFVPTSVWSSTAFMGSGFDHAHARVAVGDVDGNGSADVVEASTLTGPSGSQVPIRVSVFLSGNVTGTPDATLTSNSAPLTGTASGAAVSGQIALAVGRLSNVSPPTTATAAQQTEGRASAIVLAWTCSDATACNGAAPSTGSVAVRAIGLDITDPAHPTLVALGAAAVLPGQTVPSTSTYDAVASAIDRVSLALPDLDGDSVTLGVPRIYQDVGRTKPFVILRSPPVHFDAFDLDANGRISYRNTLDSSSCFGLNGLPKYNNECGTYASMTSTNTIGGTVATTVSSSWGVDASVTATGWFGEIEEGRCATTKTVCVDVVGSISNDWSEAMARSNEATHTFETAFTDSVLAGSDAAMVYVESQKVLEYPVYAGTSPFGSYGEPMQYITVTSPTRSAYKWVSAMDPSVIGPWSSGSYPGNLFSYPRDLQTAESDAGVQVLSVTTVAGQPDEVLVTTAGGSGFSCATIGVSDSQLTDAQNLVQYPCPVSPSGSIPVRLHDLGGGAGASYEGRYRVVAASSDSTLVLQREIAGGATFSSSTPLWSGAGSLSRTPTLLGDTGFSVTFGQRQSQEVSLGSASQASGSGTWSDTLSGSVDVSVGGGEAVAGGGVDVHIGGGRTWDYSFNQTTTATANLTVDYEIDGALPGMDYDVQPVLRQADPQTGALLLDWTASCSTNCNSSVWRQYADTPDPAFDLPRLLYPYKSPTGLAPGDHLENLLRSPDFLEMSCTRPASGTVDCVPQKTHPAGTPWNMTTSVHNYSERPFAPSQPLKIRYFLGDPARGGIPVAESTVAGEANAACVGSQSCILPNGTPSSKGSSESTGTVLAQTPWTPYAGLAGRGSPASPLALYAVLEVPKGAGDLHPWAGPIDLADCERTYPRIFSMQDTEYLDFPSLCPTSNDEAWFPARFSGPARPPVDLSVGQGDVSVAANGKTATVKFHLSKQSHALNGLVHVRLWACAATANCRPQLLPLPTNASAAGGLEKAVRVSMKPGGTASVRLPLGYAKGLRALAVEVFAPDYWEAPGGPGAWNTAQKDGDPVGRRYQGQLVDNEAEAAVSCARSTCTKVSAVRYPNLVFLAGGATAVARLKALGLSVKTYDVALGQGEATMADMVFRMTPDPAVYRWLPKGSVVRVGIGRQRGATPAR